MTELGIDVEFHEFIVGNNDNLANCLGNLASQIGPNR